MTEPSLVAEVPAAPRAEAVEPAAVSRNPFTVPGFRKWWAASIVAGTGVGIQAVTVQLFLRDRVAEEHRAAAFAAALICQALPGAAFALFGGVMADRVERRRILVRTYSIAAAVSLIYVALSGFEVSAIWPVSILGAIVGSAGAFTNPARQAMVPQIVAPIQLQNAAIFGTMAFMATLQFGGPFLGGIVADEGGLTLAFSIEVAALAVAALLFSRIATDLPVPTGKSVRRDLADGLRYVLKSPPLLGILALGTVPGLLLMGPFAVTVVLFANDVLDVSDKYVGFLWGSFGAGIVVGSALMAIFRLPRRGLLLCSSVFVGGALFAAYGLSESVWLSIGILFVAGIVGPAIFINFAVALLQENTEGHMMGRVMSMYGLAFMISTPVGYLQAGIVTSLFSPQATVVVSGAIACAIGVAAMLFLRPVKRLP